MAGAFQRVALWVTIVCCIVANCTEHSKHRLRKEKQQIAHYRKVRDFKCSLPQPRLIYIAEFKHTAMGVRYVPEATVLHRCDSSTGFCTPSSRCSAVDSDDITETFLAIPFDPSTKPYYKDLTLVNHTRCGCHHSSHEPR